MRGFSEKEAAAQIEKIEALDSQKIRSGRLFIEIENLKISEYPRRLTGAIEKKQPLVLTIIHLSEAEKIPLDVSFIPSAEQYRAGEEIHVLEGKKILDKPLRWLQGKQIEIRLAENNRTVEPKWFKIVDGLSRGASSAASTVGMPSAPPEVATGILAELRQLDLDDLILLWKIHADSLVDQVMQIPGKALRLQLRTTRVVKDGRFAGLPAATLSILVYFVSEP